MIKLHVTKDVEKIKYSMECPHCGYKHYEIYERLPKVGITTAVCNIIDCGEEFEYEMVDDNSIVKKLSLDAIKNLDMGELQAIKYALISIGNNNSNTIVSLGDLLNYLEIYNDKIRIIENYVGGFNEFCFNIGNGKCLFVDEH